VNKSSPKLKGKNHPKSERAKAKAPASGSAVGRLDEVVAVAEAMAMLNLKHPGSVRNLILRGQLSAQKIGRELFISIASIKAYKKTRPKRGNSIQ
jgi:hypothetical protein